MRGTSTKYSYVEEEFWVLEHNSVLAVLAAIAVLRE